MDFFFLFKSFSPFPHPWNTSVQNFNMWNHCIGSWVRTIYTLNSWVMSEVKDSLSPDTQSAEITSCKCTSDTLNNITDDKYSSQLAYVIALSRKQLGAHSEDAVSTRFAILQLYKKYWYLPTTPLGNKRLYMLAYINLMDGFILRGGGGRDQTFDPPVNERPAHPPELQPTNIKQIC